MGKEIIESKEKIGGKRDYLWHEEKWLKKRKTKAKKGAK